MESHDNPPLGRRETRKQDRRQAIIDAARTAFLEQGYAAMTMSGLAKTLGGSKGTLWNHFRSKEDLFAAVIASETIAFREELEDTLIGTVDMRLALFTFCRNFIRKMSMPKAMAVWRLVVGESGRFPQLGEIFYEQAASYVERIVTRYVERQILAGRLRDEGASQMARLLMDMCTGRQNRTLWGVVAVDDADLDGDAERFTDYFLRLFASPQGSIGQ